MANVKASAFGDIPDIDPVNDRLTILDMDQTGIAINKLVSPASLAALAPQGDMLKSVYDPQGLNYISGASNAGGILGGSLKLDAGSYFSAPNPGGAGGSIDLRGGNDSDQGAGGALSMRGSTFSAGSINTGGGSSASGGSIDTSNGGGSIVTSGQGSLGFGALGTRTNIQGTATADRTISYPNKDGTLATLSDLSAILTNSGLTLDPTGFAAFLALFGITPVADTAYTVGIGPFTNGIITTTSGLPTTIQQAS